MRVLVTGREGQLARALAMLSSGSIEIICVGRPELDLVDVASIGAAIAKHAPNIVVNAAAYTLVDEAESEPAAVFAVNHDGAENVAAAAASAGLPVVHISTDYVFDGHKREPYVEDDEPAPQSVYGRSKLAGERAVLRANEHSAVLRTSWVYSLWGRNFARTMLRLASERASVRVVADQHGTPTYAPDLAEGILIVCRRLVDDTSAQHFRGVFNVANGGATTWAGFAEELFRWSAARGGPFARVEPIGTADYPTAARRPANSRLDTTRFTSTFGYSLPDWREGVERAVRSGPFDLKT